MKDIVIKTTDNRVLYYYSKEGICVKNLNVAYDNPKLIFPSGVNDFDVIEHSNGEIAVICQDVDGGIVYLTENEKSYLKSTLLRNKSKIPYDKYFRLVKQKNEVIAFYIVEYDGRKILSSQYVETDNSLPYAIDETSNSFYYVFIDESDVLYIFYEKDNKCGYRYFVGGEWSNYEIIHDGKLKAAISYTGDVFLAVASKEQGKIIKLQFSSKEWKISDTDFFSEGDDVCIVYEKANIWILKKADGMVSALKCNMTLDVWDKPMIFGTENNIFKLRIKSIYEKGCPDICFASMCNGMPKTLVYKKLTDCVKRYVSADSLSKSDNQYCDYTDTIKKFNIELREIKKQINDINKLIGNSKKNSF